MALSPTIVATPARDNGLVFNDLSDPAKPKLLAHLDLETDAHSLLRAGNRLFVLGSLLTVVDISDPTRPIELKQQNTFRAARTQSSSEVLPIDDGVANGVVHPYFFDNGERIESVEIDVVVNHPQPGDLLFQLDVSTSRLSKSIVLRDHVSGPGGTRTYHFTNTKTPALQALVGGMATGEFDVRVADTVRGNVGTLLSSKVTLHTASRAFAPIAGASVFAGMLPNSRLVVAGVGLQIINATQSQQLGEVLHLSGTGAFGAVLRGTTAIVYAPVNPLKSKAPLREEVEPAPEETIQQPPVTHGLYAVSLQQPAQPKVLRTDDSFGDNGGTLAFVADRLYVVIFGDSSIGTETSTQIGSAQTFVNGGSYFLGSTSFILDGSTFGDSAFVWTVGSGHVQGFDVSNPAKVLLVKDYPQPIVSMMTVLSGTRVLLSDQFSTWTTDIAQEVFRTSRLWRITAQALDSQGGLASEARTVHVIPYDHPPQDNVQLTSGSVVGDIFTFHVTTVDPDAGQVWDPTELVRADLDGDGHFDSGWQFENGLGLDFQTSFATSGPHTVRFQARDTYFAVGETQLTVNIR